MSHDAQYLDDDSDIKPPKGLGVEGAIFLALTAFFAVATVVYGLWSGEVIGIVALALTGGLTLIIGTFLWFTGRRLDEARPEDRDAEIAEGAGELGFFSPGSYWPVSIAAAAAVFAVATAFWMVWLMIIGAGFLLMAICGFLFEYQRGHTAH